MPPIPTLFLLFIGYKVGSVVGIILAVPIGIVVVNMYEAGLFETTMDSIRILIRGFNRFRKLNKEDLEELKMKSVAVFDMRDFDEAEWFEKYSQELGLTLSPCPDAPDMENIARVTEGCECVDIITSQITREMMEEFAKSGIRYITTRTIGYDHIDLEAAKEFGIHVGNAPYGPNGVADYTVMLILMSIRKEKNSGEDECSGLYASGNTGKRGLRI